MQGQSLASCFHPGQIKGLAWALQMRLPGSITPGNLGHISALTLGPLGPELLRDVGGVGMLLS